MNQQINVKQHCWDNEKGAEMVHNDMHGTEFRLLLKKCSDKNTEYSIITLKLFHCYVFPLAQEENNSIRF